MEVVSKGLKNNEILLRVGLSNDLQSILAKLLDRGRVFAKDADCGNCANCSKCADCGHCAYCHRDCQGVALPDMGEVMTRRGVRKKTRR